MYDDAALLVAEARVKLDAEVDSRPWTRSRLRQQQSIRENINHGWYAREKRAGRKGEQRVVSCSLSIHPPMAVKMYLVKM